MFYVYTWPKHPLRAVKNYLDTRLNSEAESEWTNRYREKQNKSKTLNIRPYAEYSGGENLKLTR